MTSPISAEVDKRKLARSRRSIVSFFAGELASALSEDERGHVAWPSEKYRDNPVGFFREVLGTEPWDRQVELIEAIRDNNRVACRAGHKVSKSHTFGGVALWFYCSFDDARVVMSSTTSRQVDQILWREVRMMRARSRIPISGDMHELARSGLKALGDSDFREIVGFTAREAEAVAGVSGKNLLYLLDEASGIPEAIFEAIDGNRAGGAKVVMFSNPTRTEGRFYDSFQEEKARFWRTLHISSEESPNVKAGRIVVPGLATREWVDEMREEWGEDSALYKIRVKGEFVVGEDGKIFSVAAIAEAIERWDTATADGRLQIGIDPAGPGLGGDESVFAVRRGNKILALYPMRGLTDEAHLVHLVGMLKEHTKPREVHVPLVCVDREGPIGSTVYGTLLAYAQSHASEFELAAVRASDRALRRPDLYDRVRDELWANARDWMRDGGAIPEDAKLQKELHAPSWEPQVNGRLKVTGKDELRKELKRSPDRADAVTLAVWVPNVHKEPTLQGVPDRGGSGGGDASDDTPALDPYSGLDTWR